VRELQKKLTKLGFYNGPVTGTFGPLTKAAVKKLQKAHKLEQLGSVGPGTRKVLNK
jgi:peptidoglycan hydrolase-like protein with peptidoglycan-binding domain